MISETWVAWTLTLALLSSGAFAAHDLLRGRGTVVRIDQAIHLLMAVSMVVMTWRSTPVWLVPQLIIFGSAVVWYVARWRGLLVAKAPVDQAGKLHGLCLPWHQLLHAAMMAAMVWMLIAMPTGNSGAAGHDHQHTELSGGLIASGLPLLAAMIATSVVLLTEVRRRDVTFDRWGALGAAVMAAGMAVMLGEMLVPR